MTELTEQAQRAIEQRPIEAGIIDRVLTALDTAGDPVVSVNAAGYDDEPVTDRNEIMSIVFNLDESWLVTKSGSWVYLVLGQDWDTLTDYTMDLDDALAPVMDYIMERM